MNERAVWDTTLRCFIADDEAPARRRLSRLLAELGGARVVGEAADGVTTLERVAACVPDVLLLDIVMPELDGLGVAAALGGSASTPAVVFVTAYDEHALAAFEVSAFDYLVKPVALERLGAALAKVRSRRGPHGSVAASVDAERANATSAEARSLEELNAKLGRAQQSRRMALRCGAKFVVFEPARVHAILAEGHYCRVLLDHRELLADDPLERLEQRLAPDQFLRVHRSAIINLASLRELVHRGDRRYVAVLGDPAGTSVPVSRERLPALKHALGIG